jgi:type I restriction enzyme, R subunit
MHQTPKFQEDHSSQIPAIQFLQNLGYTYLTPVEALLERNKDNQSVILEHILETQIKKINSFEYRGEQYRFSESNIKNAINVLKDFPLVEGLVRANEQAYDLLTLGKSFEQSIDGDKKSYSLKYIDWENPENNVYHVTAEYEVGRIGREDRYIPDIVLFVNGIPLVVIEAKRPDLQTKKGDKPVDQAVSQHLRNQKMDGIPQLYTYSQLTMAIAGNDAKYATASTPAEFWSYWKEQFANDEDRQSSQEKISRIKNTPLSEGSKIKLFREPFQYARHFFDQLEQEEVAVTSQDDLLYALCRPERLLNFIYRYVIFDAGVKKVARYQQFFAVEKSTQRVLRQEPNTGRRQGGVIWHTQGSGKSLSMVMLAKSLALEPSITNPKIILVTDRVDLDDQIYRTFRSCGKEVHQAKSGYDLKKIIQSNKSSIITTVIDKFDSAQKQGNFKDADPDIFVLVDESHRSVYGETYVAVQRIFPNGCYIGFTGTPLMKEEKNTAVRFGGIIDKYTIDQAVADKAVVPLLYEGRHVVQEVNKRPLDRYFELITQNMNDEQKLKLKKKFANADQLNQADQKIFSIAWDVSLHYQAHWQGTQYKAQLTAPSKKAAVVFKKYFDEIGLVNTEVLISGPDTREGHEDIYEESTDEVQRFWTKMMARFQNEKHYNKEIINLFKNDDHPEIIIVVDKLLTGFDAPRNTVLYIARSLKEHTLLQAIARVNRVYEGKDYGYILDYYGVLGELNSALSTYSSLSEFDEEDLSGTLTNVMEEIKKLSQYHSQLWDLFKEIKNKYDFEPYEQLLADDAIRTKFYDRLSSFARTLKMALSTLEWIEETADKLIEKYKNDSKFFLQLRSSVKMRYSDDVDYSQYERQVQKLIDTHISTEDVITVSEQVNIFNKEEFEKEIDKLTSPTAKADTIASRTKKTITEKFNQDPEFYKKFSELLEEVIADYRQQRLLDADYLDKVTEIMHNVQNKTGDDIPTQLINNEVAKAFYRKSKTIMQEHLGDSYQDLTIEVALAIDSIVKQHLIVDWQYKTDVQNKIKQAIDEYFFSLESKKGVSLPLDEVDSIIESSLQIALHRPEYQ